MEQCRFPDAGGADDREHLAALDVQIQIFEYLDRDFRVAVRFREALGLEKRHAAVIMAHSLPRQLHARQPVLLRHLVHHADGDEARLPIDEQIELVCERHAVRVLQLIRRDSE